MNIKRYIFGLIFVLQKYKKAEIKISKEKYQYFTRWHRKIPFYKNKAIPCLIKTDIELSGYLKSINGKNSPCYFSRKALRFGYVFSEINRNGYLEDINKINLSAPYRQGKRMEESYVDPVKEYDCLCYGVLMDGKLVAYGEINQSNEIAVINKILGHFDYLKDGIMYLLLVGTIKRLWHNHKWIMYDSMIFNSVGMKLFKKRFNFENWRVKWLEE